MVHQGKWIGLVFGMVLFSSIASAETVTLVADVWPPFNGVPDSLREGYMVEIAREVFGGRGIQVQYELMPWNRAVELTREGRYHGVIGASETDAPGFVFPSEELSRNVLAFYVRKGFPWAFTGRGDIERVSLGVIAGYDYRTWLLNYIAANRHDMRRIQIMTGDAPLRRNILKLLDERIDAIVDNEAVIRYVARDMGILDHLALAGHDSEAAFIHIAFSPNHPDSRRYAEILSEGIRRLRTSGRLAWILSRYGLSDWKP